MCWVLDKVFDIIMVVLSRVYRWVISPFIHALAGPGYGCRFQPTCSEYAAEAVRTHGIARGIMLTVSRVGKCHPFSGKSGFDPVPPSTSPRRSHCCFHREACTPKEAVLSPDLTREKKGL